MNLGKCFMLLSGIAVLSLIVLMIGCGGASLDTGKNRNLEEVKPDFVNPPWYDDYTNDPSAAARKYQNRVLRVNLTISGFQEGSSGISVTGTTGDEDNYEIACLFPLSASAELQNARANEKIAVKGIFDHIEETSNTYQISLKNCVLARP